MYVHAINKQSYEFTCRSESVAKRVQHEMENYTAFQINHIISSVLSEHIKTDRHLKIDKIEIDLGDIFLTDFGDTGMLETFKKLFGEEILAAANADRMNHHKSVGNDTAVTERSKKPADGKFPVAGIGNSTNHLQITGDGTAIPERFQQSTDGKFPVVGNENRTNHYKSVGGDTAMPDGIKKPVDRKTPVAGNGNNGMGHYKKGGHDSAVPDPFKKAHGTVPVAGNGNKVNTYTVDDDTVLPDNLENELAIIRLFLMQGDVPWWADKNASMDFDDTLQKLMRIHPDSLKFFLEEHKDQWQVLWRLTRQYKPATRVMLEALAPGILPAAVSRKVFKGNDTLSGAFPLPYIFWVKLSQILNKHTPGSVDQLRHALVKKMRKVADFLQTNAGVNSILPVIRMAGNPPGGYQHQTRKKITKRLQLLISGLSVVQMEFLLFQLSLLPEPGTSVYRIADSTDALPNADLPEPGYGDRVSVITPEKETGLVNSTLEHPAIRPGDEQLLDQIHTRSGTAHFGETSIEAPDLLPGEHGIAEHTLPDQQIFPGDHVSAEHTLPDQLQGNDHFIGNSDQAQKAAFSSTGIKPALPDMPELHRQDKNPEAFSTSVQRKTAAGNTAAERKTADNDQSSGGDGNLQPLNEKSTDSFFKIAEELARLQEQMYIERRKRLLVDNNETGPASAVKQEISVVKSGDHLPGDLTELPALSDSLPAHDIDGKDQAAAASAKDQDFLVNGKGDSRLLNDEQQLHLTASRGKPAIKLNIPPDAQGFGDNESDLPSFTSPGKDRPATGNNKHIKKQSLQTGPHNSFASDQEDEHPRTRTTAGSSNFVERKIAFIMKQLNTTEPVFHEYLSHLTESALNRLEEILKKHIRQKLQRRNKIKAILEHPHFLKFSILKIFTNLYLDKEQEKAWSVEPEKVTAHKKARVTAVAGKIEWSQSAFLFFTDKLSVSQVMILNDIFQKQQYDSGDEKKLMKKILGKISEEGLLLIEFLTELPETEIIELLQNSKIPPADIRTGNQAPVFYEHNESGKIYVENAGLCLIANYLRGLFKRVDYLENGSFKTKASAARAIFLLQYIVSGKKKSPEHILQLNKLLCGFKTDECMITNIRLTKKEVEEADNLLQSVIENWKALKNTSLNGFRESFLQRKGILLENELYWTLQVEKKGYDLLLDSIPWGFKMIKMPWVKKYMQVEW